MLTIKPVVLPYNRRKDGTYNVKLRLTWKGRSRYLATNIMVGKSDLTRSLKIKSPDVLDACARLVRETREPLAALSPAAMESMDVSDLATVVLAAREREGFRLDFIEYGRRFALRKTPATAAAYTAALNALERFAGHPDVNDITRQMLRDFARDVDSRKWMHVDKRTGRLVESSVEKMRGGQSYRHLAKLGAIYAAAREEHNDEDRGLILIPRDPFRGVRLPVPKTAGGQRGLPVETLRRIFAADPDDRRERLALDAFRLSFCLMGANLADLYAAPAFDGVTWVYHRRKTVTRRADGAEMRVDVPPEASPYVEGLRGRGGWWLGALRQMTPDPSRITGAVNRALKRWASREGLEPFTFYAARHSWATVARNVCGIGKDTVDECLCHVGDHRLADIYIERDWRLVNEANRKVLDTLQFTGQGYFPAE